MRNPIRKHILLLAALVSAAAWAEDGNTFYFTGTVVRPGEQATVELCMKNSAADLTCLEAEVQLPEGLSVVCDEEGSPVATLYRNRTREHEMLANVLSGGSLKLLVSSAEGKLIGGEEGPLLCFRVQADEAMPVGEYEIETVGESLLVKSNAEAYYSTGVKGSVLVTDDATAIGQAVTASPVKEEGVFTLSGQKVGGSQAKDRLPRGIFIQGGRKELHK